MNLSSIGQILSSWFEIFWSSSIAPHRNHDALVYCWVDSLLKPYGWYFSDVSGAIFLCFHLWRPLQLGVSQLSSSSSNKDFAQARHEPVSWAWLSLSQVSKLSSAHQNYAHNFCYYFNQKKNSIIIITNQINPFFINTFLVKDKVHDVLAWLSVYSNKAQINTQVFAN